jgi:hypothetical protein
MKDLPINDKVRTYNKKAVMIILICIVCGIITGLILSNFFVNETNDTIKNWQSYPRQAQRFNIRSEPLTTAEIIVPTSGVIIVCIATFLLIGLIIVYMKIFLTSSSRYIVGLLFFLIPLLIQAIFSINVLRSLFLSQAFSDIQYRNILGFGASGLGGILVIVSIFEIFGLSILLYLSSE